MRPYIVVEMCEASHISVEHLTSSASPWTACAVASKLKKYKRPSLLPPSSASASDASSSSSSAQPAKSKLAQRQQQLLKQHKEKNPQKQIRKASAPAEKVYEPPVVPTRDVLKHMVERKHMMPEGWWEAKGLHLSLAGPGTRFVDSSHRKCMP